MDIVFKNTFIMTLERYMYFCDNPVGEKAEKKFRAWKIKNVSFIIVSIVCALLSVILKEWFALFLYLLACALFSYKLFYHRKKLNRQQYNHIRSTQDTSEWTRTTIFTDVIKVLEGNTETVYQHSYIKKITEDDKYYYLWHNSDSVIRLPKDGFIVGDGKEFKNYIIDRIYENRATS